MADIRTAAQDFRRGLGQGRPISPEQAGRLSMSKVAFPSFERGIDLRDVEQDQEGTSTQQGLNFELASDGSLIRTAGHNVIETLGGGRVARDMLLHTSLDYSTNLLLFDPPHLGIKTAATTSWYNVGLPTGNDWVGVCNLEKILLTNGVTGIYRRDFGATSVSLVSNSPAAKYLANYAGRVWAIGPTYPGGGTYQALGVGWSADAEGLNWNGLGSGVQLLIADTSTDDRGVALRPMSFDLLCVLCQRSIWIARPTGDLFEPAIFEPRVQGIGCASEATACLSPFGVIFLSESGVYLFDGNGIKLLSAAINGELLPVLTTAASAYAATYDSVEARYLLFTPTCTWVYETKDDRWLKWSYTATAAVAFAEQFSGVTWENVLATWDTLDGTWASIGANQGEQRLVIAKGTKLAIPSRSASSFVDGSSAAAYYGFLRRDSLEVNSFFETQRVKLRYSGGPASVDIWLPDANGVMRSVVSKSLPAAVEQDGIELGVRYTGRGIGAQLRWSDTSLHVSRAELMGLARSARRGVL